MNKFYKLDSRKVTYGEYWNITRSPMVIIPWVAKLLKIPMRFSSGMPAFDSVRELEVPEQEFSLRALDKLQPMLDQCLANGFHSPRFYTYESIRRDGRVSVISLVHESGATMRLNHSLAGSGQVAQEKTLLVLLSELQDGTFFFTSNQRKQFNSQPGVLANRLVGAGTERLLQSHLQKLAESQSTNPAKRISTTEQLDELWDRYEISSREFGMQRGIYTWMTPEEVAKEQQGLAEVAAMTPTGGGENSGVLLELHRLQNKKAGWGGIIMLLVVSLILFVGFGARQWSWNYLLMLLPILFVHELGHYLAMRAFDYRNLRMFFIPFFGAAVSGQNYNVPGWKKVVVSLLGPVPGIVLGVIIGAAGLALHQALLIKIALVTLLLNGFNLLPVLPLDGGWVFHTLLFSRHHILDALFRGVAAAALMVGGSLMGNKILMYLGIPMLIGIPSAYRTARIASELKQRGLPPTAENIPNVPVETANVIIAEIRKATDKPQSNTAIAQQTLQIFETINARPPGWAATLGLLFVHLTSFALAAVFVLVLVIGQRGSLASFLANAANLPTHKLACGSSPAWIGNEFSQSSAKSNLLLVATFRKHAEVEPAYRIVTGLLPANTALKMFGDTLLLSLPPGDDAARKKWLTHLQGLTKDVFVDSTNYHAAFSISCIAPDAKRAEAIVSELDGYFNTLPGESLVPPWQRGDARSQAARAAGELARQTYLKLLGTRFQSFTNAELRALEKQLSVAQKQADQAEVEKLQSQITALSQRLDNDNIECVRSGAVGAVDAPVVDLFVTLNEPQTRTNRVASAALRQQLAKRMGQLPAADGLAASGDFSAHYGSSSRSGLIVNLRWISFDRLDEGPMALADWLCQQGCTALKYDFLAGMGSLSGEESD